MVQDNHLTGMIPPVLGSIPSLLYLYVSHSADTKQLKVMSLMMVLKQNRDLNGNQFWGTIPLALASSKTLLSL